VTDANLLRVDFRRVTDIAAVAPAVDFHIALLIFYLCLIALVGVDSISDQII